MLSILPLANTQPQCSEKSNWTSRLKGSGRYISFTIAIMQVEQGAPELAVITASDVTEQVQIKKRLEAVEQEHAELVGELSAANKRFIAMNKELQDANEELQAANEELMLTQEELQATNEEFEATNEELQATNEELETNNEELQATNEELQTTNDELTARTIELQELTKHHIVQDLQLSVGARKISSLRNDPECGRPHNSDDQSCLRRLFGNRNVNGLPISEVFSGKDLNELIKVLKKAIREVQSVNTAAIKASVDGDKAARYIHTVVPITDASGSSVSRMLIYSELAD